MRIAIIFAILLASCGTTHKTVNKSERKVDSVATTSIDTSRVIRERSSSSQVTAKDIHVRIEYGDSTPSAADTALAAAISRPARPATRTGNKIVDAISAAIAASGRSARLIDITIGSVSDSSSIVARKDSGAGKINNAVTVTTVDKAYNKDVTSWHLTWWMWLLIIAAVVFILYRLNKKYNWIRIFP